MARNTSFTLPRTAFRLSLYVLAGALASATADAQTVARSTSAAPVPRHDTAEYVVGPKDVLAVTVRNQPTLSSRYTIEEDGTLNFPLIGRMKAAGLTVRAVESELAGRLAEGFFNNPEISITIEEYRSQRVLVMGEVQQPGPYTLSGRTTLLEMLALARSTTPAAAKEAIITRAGARAPDANGPTDPEVLHVDLNALQTGNLADNLVLHDGDSIFIPRASTVMVVGEVRSSGPYPIGKETTVAEVLALAGWITDRGDKDRIEITRTVDGKRKAIGGKLGDVVKPNDIIKVKPRLF